MIKTNLAIKTLIDNQIAKDVSVSDKQIRTYYDEHPDLFRRPEQVKASHILIKVPENASEEEKAAALFLDPIAETTDRKWGGSFANLAMEYSDCPSKTKGGDLGFFYSQANGQNRFSDAAFALQPGQVSDVVTTQFGYHLIRVTERQEARTMCLQRGKRGYLKPIEANSYRKKTKRFYRKN